MPRNIADFNTGRGFVDPDPYMEDTGEEFDWMQTNLTDGTH
jgi:hypothetical protein